MSGELMDLLTNPEFVKVILAIVGVISAIVGVPIAVVGVWAYRAKKGVDKENIGATTLLTVAESIQTLATTVSTNATNNAAERTAMAEQAEKERRANAEESAKERSSWREQIDRQFTQLGLIANNLSANTEALQGVRSATVEAVKSAVGEGLSSLNQDVQALTREVAELKTVLQAREACDDGVKTKLESVESLLRVIQGHITKEVPPSEVKPVTDIAPPVDPPSELPKAI